jgi:hypothetical protein
MKTPKQINIDIKEVDATLERVKNDSLQNGDYEMIKSMFETVIYLNRALDNKTTSIKRLLKMLFGVKTEKSKNKPDQSDKKDPKPSQETSENSDKPDSDNNPDIKPGDASENKPEDTETDGSKKKPGHGRNGASAYTGADKEFIPLSTLTHGDSCLFCDGKVYKQQKNGVFVRIGGVAPLSATVYELEKLRCNLCGEIFTAQMPDRPEVKKYDESSKAMIVLLKYGSGVPFYRIEKLQDSLGIPVSTSTQWDKVEEAAMPGRPVFEELKRQAAQGNIIHNDDTTMKVLDLLKENETKGKNERTGIFTTGILSILDDRKIVLFHTGRKHAGENLAEILGNRNKEKDPPIQMCDASLTNIPGEFKTILCNCLTHGRRQFVEEEWNFPDECQYVIKILGKVYKHDKDTKEQNMSPDQRLQYHQEKSGPLIEKLKDWLTSQIEQNLVEPNSGLGQAISYMLNHWPKLTRFLSVPGAPLDNNVCEQALKRAILHRKNSLFYKNMHGAYIGDIFMSLIHTCNIMNINPFNYLVAIQKYSSEVFRNPSRWMPWNFMKIMALLKT